jgi:uncharacterized protein (TIGR03000 family)
MALCVALATLTVASVWPPGRALAEPPVGMSKMWPWNVNHNYVPPGQPRAPAASPPLLSPRRLPGPAAPVAAAEAPRQYLVRLVPLPEKTSAEEANRVVFLSELPAGADVWFEDLRLPRNDNTKRRFISPPLTPGQTYTYYVRLSWEEEGRRAQRDLKVRVEAGDTFRLDVLPLANRDVRAEITSNLRRLSPEDQKLAEEQGSCAVQESIELEALGVPVRVVLNGQPIFLSGPECAGKAEKNPEQTLARVNELRAKKLGLVGQ